MKKITNEEIVKYWEDKAEKDRLKEDILLYILIGVDIIFAIFIIGVLIATLIRMFSL